MFNSIVIVLERAASVVRRVNEDALDLAGELLFERFEGEQIVAKDQPVIEAILAGHPVRRVIRLHRVFQQNARLQPGPVLLPNPRQFKALLLGHAGELIEAATEEGAKWATVVGVG